MFKHLIFDFDNTIYNYDVAHKNALHHIFNLLSKKYDISTTEINKNYDITKEKYQNMCYNHASSHNKFIQLKHLFNILDILDNQELLKYHDIYTTKFNENLQLFDGVIDFLDLCFDHNVNMYILTNNLCKEQIEKINILNIEKYFKKIYTSEEFGIEKPDHKLFYYIIADIGCTKDEIANIGDSYDNDIISSRVGGMYSFWFNMDATNIDILKPKITNNTFEFSNYQMLIEWFYQYYVNCSYFIDYSHMVGERFDLTQAGGGNTSFKIDDYLFIKSSGSLLSTIDINENYVGVNYKHIVNYINASDIINISNDDDNNNDDDKNIEKKHRENISKSIVNDAIIFLKKFKPSIETAIHTYTKKYTIHIHPIQFNTISSLSDCDEILNSLFGNKDVQYCLLEYDTPGIDVTLQLLRKYKYEDIIFMKNHGIIITSNSIGTLYITLHNVLEILQSYDLSINFQKYKYVNDISSTMKGIYKTRHISYLSEDVIINDKLQQYINNNTLFDTFLPDKLVYCGCGCIVIDKMLQKKKLTKEIYNYMELYCDMPKIIIIKNYVYDDKTVPNNRIKGQLLVYITSTSLKKCIEIESVFKSHLMCFNCKKKHVILDKHECDYLSNWDAEKYRQNC